MVPSLQGRICLVTGACRGIGKGIALQLGAAGATVYITGRLKIMPARYFCVEYLFLFLSKLWERQIFIIHANS
jgi:hypothetical protein